MGHESFLEGRAFLDSVARAEEACVAATLDRIRHLGARAAQTQERLGDVLSLLYREALCYYGCKGGDHFGERVTARIVNHSLASYRLLASGYYDESLALTRNLGEAANLLYLFSVQPALIDEWRNADKEARKQMFAPVKIRLRLEEAGEAAPINELRYAGLCEAGVHLGPHSRPQAYNPGNRPTLGAIVQEGGILAALNELSGAAGVCAVGLLQLLDLGARRDIGRQAAVNLLESVGGLDLSALRRVFRGV